MSGESNPTSRCRLPRISLPRWPRGQRPRRPSRSGSPSLRRKELDFLPDGLAVLDLELGLEHAGAGDERLGAAVLVALIVVVAVVRGLGVVVAMVVVTIV